jgi:hypothetical protein
MPATDAASREYVAKSLTNLGVMDYEASLLLAR